MAESSTMLDFGIEESKSSGLAWFGFKRTGLYHDWTTRAL